MESNKRKRKLIMREERIFNKQRLIFLSFLQVLKNRQDILLLHKLPKALIFVPRFEV